MLTRNAGNYKTTTGCFYIDSFVWACEQESQKRIPSSVRYLDCMPSNFVRAEWQEPFGKLNVRAVYTLPLTDVDMPMDESTSREFQRLVGATSDNMFDTACENLRLLRDDDAMPDGKRLHLGALRNLFSKPCAVAVLQNPFKGHHVICTCF